MDAIARFLAQTIAARDDLVLPLHGGPVSLDARTLALRAEIRELLEQVLARGRRDGSIRADATATDIIITGAMLAQPLAHVDRLGPARATAGRDLHRRPRGYAFVVSVRADEHARAARSS